jgi:ribosomal protein S12 methylthiotransferase accessory factor
MGIRITFPEGMKVVAEFENGLSVATDQPPDYGGEGSAPSPFDLFLASLGTCAGVYVLGFCRHRGIPTEGLALRQWMEYTDTDDGKKRLAKVGMEITAPSGFPEKYQSALIRTAELCAVKKALMDPPEFVITVTPA